MRRYTEKNLRTVNFFMLISIAPRPAARSRRAGGRASPAHPRLGSALVGTRAGEPDAAALGADADCKHKGQAAPATGPGPQDHSRGAFASGQEYQLPAACPAHRLHPASLRPIRVRRCATPTRPPTNQCPQQELFSPSIGKPTPDSPTLTPPTTIFSNYHHPSCPGALSPSTPPISAVAYSSLSYYSCPQRRVGYRIALPTTTAANQRPRPLCA